AGDGEHRVRAQFFLFDVGHGRRQGGKRDRRVAADRGIDRERRAVERHGDEIELILLLEELARQMRRRAGGGLRETVLAGVRLHQLDELLERLCRKAGVDRNDVGRAATNVIGAKSLTGSYGTFAYMLGLTMKPVLTTSIV